MRIVITGAAGFIGRNLGLHLSQHERVGVDWVPLDEVLGFDERICADLRDDTTWDRIFDSGTVDAIVHLAAIPGIAFCEEYPDTALGSNVQSVCEMFSALHRHDWKGRLIFASTVAPPQNSLYGATKRIGEMLLDRLTDYGPSVAVLRFANVYGELSSDKDHAVANFIRAAIGGEPLQVWGGQQTRDFVYVQDVCRAIEAALLDPRDELFYVGTGELTSVVSLADMVMKYFPNAKAQYYPDDSRGTVSAAPPEGLAYLPADPVRLAEGLDRTVRWFRSTYHPKSCVI